MDPRDVVSELDDQDWGDDFAVTYIDEDIIYVQALASAGDAIDVEQLNSFMSENGYHLGYVVSDCRELQYKHD